jgi:hypothetical protein
MLLGDQAVELGEVIQAELGSSCALALSRGRFAKGYPYLDPNEDACLAATDGHRYLLAVADGHNGFDAARAAITALDAHSENILGSAEPSSVVIEVAGEAVLVVALRGAPGVCGGDVAEECPWGTGRYRDDDGGCWCVLQEPSGSCHGGGGDRNRQQTGTETIPRLWVVWAIQVFQRVTASAATDMTAAVPSRTQRG